MTKKQLIAKAKLLAKQLDQIDIQIGEIEDVESGDKPDAAAAKRIKAQGFSFVVNFLRRKALNQVKNPGVTAVSCRRFSSQKEANQHGKRFAKKHNHKCFTVVIVNKKANAWINWKTGKTNPVIG